MTYGNTTKKMAKFCKESCPICKTARKKGKGMAYQFVKLENRVCPMCRAYEKVYGKKAYE